MPDVKDLRSELASLIAKILEIGEDGIGLDTKFVEDLGMDSVMALEILATIEKKYRIQIPEEELVKMSTLREVIEITRRFMK